MAETQPPFADTNQFAERWPSVSRPEMHSPAFHDFLLLCSEPAPTRPSASELLNVGACFMLFARITSDLFFFTVLFHQKRMWSASYRAVACSMHNYRSIIPVMITLLIFVRIYPVVFQFASPSPCRSFTLLFMCFILHGAIFLSVTLAPLLRVTVHQSFLLSFLLHLSA
jgi:hypothetical protein